MNRIIYILLIVFTISACQKEASDIFEPYPNHPLNDTVWVEKVPETAAANQLRVEFSKTPLIDSFNASVTSVLHFSNDLEITIPANSCVFSNGTEVTSKVVLQVNHLRKKGDFISFARPTSSYASALECGSSLYLNALSDGKEVFIKPNKRFILSFKDADPQTNMRVFYGLDNPTPPLPLGTNELFTWVPSVDTTNVSTFTRIDSTGIVKGYNMFSNKFNWISCSHLLEQPVQKTQINVLMPSNYTNTNTTVYAFLKDKNTVVQLYGDFKSRSFFAPELPVNSDVTLVTLSLRGNEFYLSKKEIFVSPKMIISVSPEQQNKGQITQYLQSF